MNDRRMQLAAMALMLGSGAVGVAEEVLLARWLGLLLGHAAAAQATVLAAWMGGLGVGAIALGPGADRSPSPMRRYAALELGAALLCALWPTVAPPLATATVAWPAGLRAAALAATLLPPAFLLGGTLPAMVRAVTGRPGVGGRALSLLYAANSAGAALGALGGGVALLGAVGLRHGLLWVCGAGVGIALVAEIVGQLAARAESLAEAAGPRADGPDGSDGSGDARTWLAVAALGGGLALAVEALWMRLLGTVLGASAYAFAGVVAVTVLGVAAGSAWVRRPVPAAQRVERARAAALWAATSLVAVGWLGERLPWWLAAARSVAAPLGGVTATLLAQALLTLVVVLPSAAALGALLPLAGAGVIAARGRVARGAAEALAANTVGAVLGAALTQPLWVPALGLHGALRAFTLGTLVVAWLPRAGASRALSGRQRTLLVALAAGAVLAPRWDARLLHAGAFRGTPREPPTFSAWTERLQREAVVFAADGAEASVAVLERDGDRVLKLQGKADASSRGDMLTQVLSAWLPMAAAARPERVLVIGMGSGVTAGVAAALQRGGLAGVADVDVVELEPAVLAAARAFDAFSHGASAADGIRLHAADARGWLLRQPEARWDVLISEPSNPWMAGNGNLFTVEWLEAMRARLRPGGVLAQWFHAYEMSDALQTAVFATVAEVFPHVRLYALHPGDVLMLASAEPIALDRQRLAAWWARPELRADLDRLDVAGVAGLRSLEVLGEAAFRRDYASPEARAAGLLRDDLPRLELEAPRSLWRGDRARKLLQRDERRAPAAMLAALPDDPASLRALLAQHTRFPAAPMAFRLALFDALAPRADVDTTIALAFTALREAYRSRGRADGAALVEHDADAARRRVGPLVARLARDAETQPRAHLVRALAALLAGDAEAGAAALRRCVTLGDEPAGRCRRLLGEAEARRSNLARRLLR